jgi:hypothetical protein
MVWMDDNVGFYLAMSVMVAAEHLASDVFSPEMGLVSATYFIYLFIHLFICSFHIGWF